MTSLCSSNSIESRKDFEGQGVGGILRGRQVLAGSSEQVVQSQLVRPSQGAPEAGKGVPPPA